MALLTPLQISNAGIDQEASAVASDVAGDSVVASSGIFIQVFNGDASPHTVTTLKPKASALCPPYGTVALEDIVISIPASESRSFTLPLGYKDVSNQFVWAYDDVTSMTVAVFSLA